MGGVTTLWDFYWPVVLAGLVLGLIAGFAGFRPRGGTAPGRTKRNAAIGVGAAAAVALSALWHGPIGTGERMAAQIEAAVRTDLNDLELPFVQGRLERAPLSRTLVLSGPADEFQHRELPRYMLVVPGVARVRWSNPPARRLERR